MEHTKKLLNITWIVLILMNFSYGEKVASFTEFANPYSICVDSKQLYISQGVTVFIYSLDDYRLVKTFGREGEGPGEFQLRRQGGNDEVLLGLAGKHLVVSTVGKLVYFSRQGEFVKEIKTAGKKGRWFFPFGQGFAATRYIRGEDKRLYHAVTLYDRTLEPVREIYRHIHGFQGFNQPFNPLAVEQADFDIAGDHLFLINGERTFIRVYDREGKALAEMRNNSERVPFTDQDREEMIRGYQHNAMWKRFYASRKHLFKFPGYYPPIRWFFLDPVRERVYVKTEKMEAGQREWLVFDFRGTLLRKPVLRDGLFRFYDGVGYCLTENDEEEVWELHRIQIESR
jgi:hypothetical protein